ncbi:MAG TPA: CGNR zinc finger domain-containing protein [Pseudonocardiaceae bacterium]
MQFNHYGGEAALLGADLVNLRPPITRELVVQVLISHQVADPALSTQESASIADWGGQLSRCFDVAEAGAQCDTVNELLSAAASKPYVSRHDGHPHLHYRSMEDDVVSRVRAITITGLAYIICIAGGHRLGRCAHPGCALAYVDTSRNGRRRYCSVRCANTSAVRRHRRRTRS